MAIENIEKELKKIYEQIESDQLVLPNFQRGFVWDSNKQQQLLASFLVDLPIGSLLILEGNADDFTKRKLCFPDPLHTHQQCQYVLDGQQRLSTLRTMLYDIFNEDDSWEDVWTNLYGKLRARWFLRVKALQEEHDYFGLNDLDFKSLNRLTDTDIYDFIERKPVYKTKTNEIHHPGYLPADENGQKIEGQALVTNFLAKKYAESYLVPLYEIYKGERGIHMKVLEKIAASRVDHFKALAEQEGHSLSFYKDIFKPIESTVDEADIEVKLQENKDQNDNLKKDVFSNEWARLSAKWVEKFSSELNSLINRSLSIIFLQRNELDRAIAIFEAINRGGEPLSVYDLVVAKSARDKGVEHLTSRIVECLNTEIDVPKELSEEFLRSTGFDDTPGCPQWLPNTMNMSDGNDPTKTYKDWFVNVLSLLAYTGKGENSSEIKVEHIKRDKILSLSSTEVNEYAGLAIIAINRALAFLQIRCGVTDANKNIPYKLMLVVLAYHLFKDEVWTSKKSLDRLEYWYWTSLLGGAYFARQNEQCTEDIINLDTFLKTGENKFKVNEAHILNYQDYATDSMLLREDESSEKEHSAATKGILHYMLSKSPYDFNVEGHQKALHPWDIAAGTIIVELHHVIPLGRVTKIGEMSSELRNNENHPLNSTLNLAFIKKESNREISDKSPYLYLEVIDQVASDKHFLPSREDIKKAMDNEQYKDVLKRRLEFLKWDIRQHLDKLKK